MQSNKNKYRRKISITGAHQIQAVNAALEIVKLEFQRFTVPGGYIKPTGYAFKHPEYGYLAFNDTTGPYNPCGGKNALEEIMATGGFIHFDDMVWLSPMQ
ncbi:3-isopropylmalate dehydratase [Paenibacillus glucanolyticus]|uniref:3-isopropylmalate dehydratase n=1 Tax=Paenibacillus glucanolyticus TaxID=59843 RepID=UPI0021168963|nr:3-isopropylmalate dehydratase [Paenibacillus glucanolyticus]